jgi:hypothetical protein
MATSTKNTKFSISNPVSKFAVLTPTAITKAAPALVSVTSVAGIVDGDVVKIDAGGTGFFELDNQSWIVSSVNVGSNTFALLGSDTTASTGTLTATPVIKHAVDADLSAITCALMGFEIQNNTPGDIDAGTYCSPSDVIPSIKVAAPSCNFNGAIDITNPGYKALLAAEEDGLERIIRITLPNNQYLVAPGIVASFGFSVPLDGIQGFSGVFKATSKFRHRF